MMLCSGRVLMRILLRGQRVCIAWFGTWWLFPLPSSRLWLLPGYSLSVSVSVMTVCHDSLSVMK